MRRPFEAPEPRRPAAARAGVAARLAAAPRAFAALDANLRASLLMMLGMAGFTINDALVKSLGGALPASQVIAVRGSLLCLAFALLLGRMRRRQRRAAAAGEPDDEPPLHARDAVRPLVLLRGTFEMVATFLFLAALVRMPFASIAALLSAMPLAVTAGAALLLGERVGPRRWTAILVGLAGVLLIVRPGTDGFDAASLLMIGCVLLSAGRDLVTRRVPAEVPSLLVTAVSAAIIATGGTVLATLAGAWVPMAPGELARLVGAAFFVFFGMHGVVTAMRLGEVGAVAPFRYTGLVWAMLIGWLAFAEVPDGWTLAGAAVIVATGLFTLARERALRRAAAARADGGTDGEVRTSIPSAP